MRRQLKQCTLTAALLLGGILVAPASASDLGDVDLAERAAERATDVIYIVIICYDSEGSYGLLPQGYYNINPLLEELYVEYQFAEGRVTRVEGDLSFVADTDRPTGTPFGVRVHATQFGSILGFSRVNVAGGYPRFTVPVPASSLGLTNGPSKYAYSGVPPEGHGTSIGTSETTFLADTRDAPAVAVPVYLIPNSQGRTPTLTAEYLAGNASQSLGQEVLPFATGWFAVDGTWIVSWGRNGPPYPDIIWVPSHLPIGPIRGTLGLSGYLPDSVDWQAEDLHGILWTPLLSAIPGSVDSPSPSEILDLNTLGVLEGAFILEPAIREKLLGQSELFTNLKAASDLNQDGVLDAADFVPLQAGEGRQ